MTYKALIMDFDGTLRPGHEPRITRPVADALLAVQKAGVKLVLATGRTFAAVEAKQLRGIRMDGYVCGNGAQVLSAKGEELRYVPMTTEAMYALVDFCEDYEYPLAFAFKDGYYAYVGYEEMARVYGRITGVASTIRDGEDQDHHLLTMPFTAFCIMPPEAREAFNEKYPYFGFRFLPYAENSCDVVCPGQDKQSGVEVWMESVRFTAADVVAVGDGLNDMGMIAAAGCGVAMKNAFEEVKQIADRICPADTEDGVAALCREVFPEVFA